MPTTEQFYKSSSTLLNENSVIFRKDEDLSVNYAASRAKLHSLFKSSRRGRTLLTTKGKERRSITVLNVTRRKRGCI